MNPKFFTVEEANALIGFLENSLERIRRNRQRYLWLMEEVAILKLIVECGADEANSDSVDLEEKTHELKAVEEEATKTIAIGEFVPQAKVDTVYYDKAYYLAPDKGGERAYKLLSEAMKRSQLVGLAQYAARGKAYLVLLRPVEGGLVMQQLHYAEEVRPISEIPLPEKIEVKEAELTALADQALADFAAREGISLPGQAQAPAARTMGAAKPESESQGG